MFWIRCVRTRRITPARVPAGAISPLPCVIQVNSLLPTDTFIVVMRGLMGNELPSVRRKAMELLNNKLLHRTQWDQEQVTAAHLSTPHNCVRHRC